MVPNGWKEIKLKDIGLCITGLTYSPKNVVENGLLVLRSSNVQGSKLAFEDNVYVNLEIAEKAKTKYGDILLCVRNGSRRLIGKSALINKTSEGYAHGAFMGLFRSKDTPEYTFQMFQSSRFFQQVNQNIGATINSINSGNLYHFKFPYPPITERNRIAKILGTWDKAMSTTERLIDNSKQQKKALMQQLLTGKKRLIDDSGKPFDGEWEEVTIGSTSKCFSGGTPSRSKEEYYGGDIPWITSGKLNDRFVTSVKEYISELGLKNSSAKVVKNGSLLIAMYGATAGKVAVNKLNGATVNQAVLALEPNKHCHNLFLFYLFEVEMVKALKLVQGGQPNLSAAIIKGIKIKLPSLTEQRKIAVILTNAEKEVELLEQQCAHLKQEKKALMQQLLTGKRRVKVDITEAA